MVMCVSPEITNMFADLLTTVKSHLTAKLSLYSSLSTRCARQMEEIEESKRELGRVRKDMESGAGGVVAGELIGGVGENGRNEDGHRVE